MFPSKTSLVLFLGALAGTAVACGPFFPSTIIDNPEAALAAPYGRFADLLAKLPLARAEFRAVANDPQQDYSARTLQAEVADLAAAGVPVEVIERHRIRRAALAGLLPLPAGQTLPAELMKTEALPAEFADYQAAACAYFQGDIAAAVRLWQHLLARPAAERKYKSTLAAFMLGRAAGSAEEARACYQQTRQWARDGFADTLGLAAASLGWEAKTWLDAGNYRRAAELYLAQFATGDSTAANSLRFLATRVATRADDAQLAAFANDARLRGVMTALLLNRREDELPAPAADALPSAHAGVTARWLQALERAGVSDAAGAAALALAAYRAGEFDLTTRWLKLASADDAVALWLKAKLAIRRGDIDAAAQTLSTFVHHAQAKSGRLADLLVYEDSEWEPASAESHLLAELGALKLAHRDYNEALDLLLRAGYWEDSAYLAENVLTVDELKTYVDAQAGAAPMPAGSAADRSPDLPRNLRHLLARRLVRRDRLDEARGYFPAAMIPTFDRFVALLHAGQDRAQPDAVRAAALMDAARVMYADGMALRGTELEPDYAIWEGNYASGMTLVARERLAGPLRPTGDEHVRASLPEANPSQRFHYRTTAAGLAWSAIALMPDESDVTARALVEAGGWLKRRDPHAANPFYQALVRRCRQTQLGAAAADLHWFPNERL